MVVDGEKLLILTTCLTSNASADNLGLNNGKRDLSDCQETFYHCKVRKVVCFPKTMCTYQVLCFIGPLSDCRQIACN